MLIEGEKDNLCFIATKYKRYKLSIIFVSFESGKIRSKVYPECSLCQTLQAYEVRIEMNIFAECATAVAAKVTSAATIQTMIKSDKRKSTKFD